MTSMTSIYDQSSIILFPNKISTYVHILLIADHDNYIYEFIYLCRFSITKEI